MINSNNGRLPERKCPLISTFYVLGAKQGGVYGTFQFQIAYSSGSQRFQKQSPLDAVWIKLWTSFPKNEIMIHYP